MINGMINLDDNQQFITNVFNIQSSNTQVFIDQSHLPSAPVDEGKAVLNTIYGLIASPIGTLTLIAVILALSLIPFWKRRGKI
jgi:hypothetical protein